MLRHAATSKHRLINQAISNNQCHEITTQCHDIKKDITNVATLDIQCRDIDSETQNINSMSRHRVSNVTTSAERKRKEDPAMSQHQTTMLRHQSLVILRQCRDTRFDPRHSSFNVTTSPRHFHDIDWALIMQNYHSRFQCRNTIIELRRSSFNVAT